jgi:hypothetical protein
MPAPTIAALMGGDPPAAMEHLDCARGDAHVDFGANEGVRHRVEEAHISNLDRSRTSPRDASGSIGFLRTELSKLALSPSVLGSKDTTPRVRQVGCCTAKSRSPPPPCLNPDPKQRMRALAMRVILELRGAVDGRRMEAYDEVGP